MTPKHEDTDAMGMESQSVDHETEAFKVLQVIEQRAWALGDEQYARLAKEAKDHLSLATPQPAEQSASNPVEGEELHSLVRDTVASLLNQARKPEGAEPVAYAIFWRHAMTLHPTLDAAETARKGVPHDIVPLYAHPAHEAGEVERLRAALDHPLLREVHGFVEDAAPDEVMAVLRLWQDEARAALEDKS